MVTVTIFRQIKEIGLFIHPQELQCQISGSLLYLIIKKTPSYENQVKLYKNCKCMSVKILLHFYIQIHSQI